MAKRRKLETKEIASSKKSKKSTTSTKQNQKKDDTLVDTFVDRLVDKFQQIETTEKSNRGKLHAAFQTAITSIKTAHPALYVKIETKLEDIFQSVFTRLNPEDEQGTEAEEEQVGSLMGTVQLQIALKQAAEASPSDAVAQYEKLLSVYPKVKGSDVIPQLLAQAHEAVGSWNCDTASPLINRLVSTLSYPYGSTTINVLVLLELFVNHVAQPCGEGEAMRTLVEVAVWKRVLTLTHLCSLEDKATCDSIVRNGGRYCDFTAAALAIYVQLSLKEMDGLASSQQMHRVVDFMSQLCASRIGMICDTLLQTSWTAKADSNADSIANRWLFVNSVVAHMASSLAQSRQATDVDTFVRVVLVSRMAFQHGTAAKASKKLLRSCQQLSFGANAFTFDQLKIRLNQILSTSEGSNLLKVKDTEGFARAVVTDTTDSVADAIFDGLCGVASDNENSDVTDLEDSSDAASLFFLDDVGIQK